MRTTVRAAVVAALAVIGSLVLAPASRGAPDDTVGPPPGAAPKLDAVGEWTLDLLTGKAVGTGPLALVDGPRDVDGDGTYEAVVRVDLSGLRGLRVRATYGRAPTGLTLDVGDSATNNGWAGDSCTQSRDAEAQVAGDEVSIFGSDHTPQGVDRCLWKAPGAVRAGDTLVLTVLDLACEVASPRAALPTRLASPALFALCGEPDTEGSVNADIYVGINRSIGTDSRRGSGITRLVLEPLD